MRDHYNMAESILRTNLEEGMWVVMKSNTVLPGKESWFTVNLLVYLHITHKTYLENATLLWKIRERKEFVLR